MKLILPAQPPFSLSSVVRSHGWIRLDPFWEEESIGGLAYIAQLDSGQVVELHIQEVPGGVSVSFDGDLNDDEHAEIERSVNWMLGLDQNFSTFYQLARQEPKLASAEQRAQGTHPAFPLPLRGRDQDYPDHQHLVGCHDPYEQ